MTQLFLSGLNCDILSAVCNSFVQCALILLFAVLNEKLVLILSCTYSTQPHSLSLE